MTATGWTFAEIDELPFREIAEQFEYWAEYPPMHLLLRAYVGFKPMPSDGPRKRSFIPGKKLARAPKWERDIFEQLKAGDGR